MILTVGLFIVAATARAELRWNTYLNRTVGYSVTYPSYLELQPWPKDKDPNSSEQWRSKVFSGEEGNWYIFLTFAYPHSTRKSFDSIVTKIVHDFRPNLPGAQDH
jgi:hypothetical protein